MENQNKEVFEQLSKLDFILELERKYSGIYPFNETTITIEHLDEFGQCMVHLGFEDQFAIRDSFGNWRQATAEECLELSKGELKGSAKLI
ncbi:hypothetical protein AB6F62_20370 [Providencia huaxiensis]|uniref:hypothetical protein n=1 Tax=Providencia huaxiensis TaxID=2027290 RepID=UPI0034DDBEA2